MALLAVGSDLRGDDAAGLLVADYLEKDRRLKTDGRSLVSQKSAALPPSAFHSPPFFQIFRGHTAPENCTGEIKKYAPTHLVIVDAADMRQPPGHVELLESDQIGGLSFSTHQMPLRMLIDYLKTSITFEAIVIAIQPAHLDYDRAVTPAVRRAAHAIARALATALKNA